MNTASSFYARQLELKKVDGTIDIKSLKPFNLSQKMNGTQKEVKPVTNPPVKLPTYAAAVEDNGYASIHQKPVGIMNSEEAKPHKWDPSKNFPSLAKPERPADSLGARFGPSETEVLSHLPSQQELFLANKQVVGPKYIRTGPKFHRNGDMRPIMIPQDYDDYEKVRRPNRPRINQDYYKEAIEMEKRYYQHSMPSIIPPLHH